MFFTVLLGSPPYHRVIRAAQQEADGHQGEVVRYILSGSLNVSGANYLINEINQTMRV